MSPTARIVASLTEPPTGDELANLSSKVDVLEIRADLVKDLDATWLRQNFPGQLLYTLRSREEGGLSEASAETRCQRIIAAAKDYDLIDLEASRDLQELVLAAVDPSKRVISWHGPHAGLSQLRSTFEAMAEHGARYYKLVPEAVRPRHEMAPLALLHSLRRDDVIAFASGPIGSWTRLVAPRLGAAVVFAAVGSKPAAPGQLTVEELIDDFNLPDLPRAEFLFGLVGARIKHSLSPRIHNRLYRDLGLPGLYVPFHVEDFGDFWIDVIESGSFEELGFELRGLSVTSPHKRIASAVAGARSPLVDLIASANTLVYRNEVWEAESTDGEGVVSALLETGTSVAGASAAVIGAGGAGRSILVALSQAGASVTLVNRNQERGQMAASRMRVPYRALEAFDPGGFDIVVNATPLGSKAGDPLPVEPSRIDRGAVVLDMVYSDEGLTDLVREARSVGRLAIDGRVPLLHQARPQFRLMTGHEPSIEDLRDLVGV